MAALYFVGCVDRSNIFNKNMNQITFVHTQHEQTYFAQNTNKILTSRKSLIIFMSMNIHINV